VVPASSTRVCRPYLAIAVARKKGRGCMTFAKFLAMFVMFTPPPVAQKQSPAAAAACT